MKKDESYFTNETTGTTALWYQQHHKTVATPRTQTAVAAAKTPATTALTTEAATITTVH